MQQDASVSGTGNVVVQIVGDGNRVEVGHPHLTLTLYLARRQIRTDLDRLSPYTRSVPLIGRDREMASLWAFLDDPRPLTARVLIGGAGSGKTRLALELCEQAHAKGWSAGFVGRHELKRFFTQQNLSVWGWNRPTLMVVDYAAEHAELLGQWLDELADRLVPDGTPPLRLLLLERHASTEAGWWTTVFASGGYGASGKRALLDPPKPVPVHPLALGNDRLALLNAMLMGGSAPIDLAELDNEELGKRLMEREWGGDPLFLMMAALQASRVGVQALSLGRLDLACELAERECDRLQYLAKARLLDPVLVLHLAACVTLAQGLGRSEFEEFADREKLSIHRSDGGDAAQIADLLQEALPRLHGIAPVLPDLIGEALVLRIFGRATDMGIPAVSRCYAVFGQSVAESVIRSTQDFAPHSALLLRWLDAIFEAAGDCEDRVAALTDSLPVASVVLRNFNLRVAQKLHAMHIKREDLAPEVRAASLHALSLVQAQVGQWESALRTAEETAVIYRKIVESGSGPFLPQLAASLNTLANRLSDMGQYESALEMTRGVTDIYRVLAEQLPEIFRPALAMALDNHATSLSALGHYKCALKVAKQAVSLYRELTGQRPDVFRPDLARALHNVANRFSELGKREHALGAAQEALGLYRELAGQLPDVFLPYLAGTLNNVANRMNSVGQYECALQAAGEAVDLYRELAGQLPNSFLPDLAMSLNNFAAMLGGLGQHETALDVAREAVDLYRKLVQSRPDSFNIQFNASLNNLANEFSELGNYESALEVVQEAVELCRRIYKQQPDVSRPALAMSLNNFANRLMGLGHLESAIDVVQEAVELRRELSKQRPDAFLPDLAMSLNNFAAMLSGLGQYEHALEATREGIAIYRGLQKQNSNAFQSDLAISLNNFATILCHVRQYKRALEAAREAADLYRNLVKLQPDVFRSSSARSLIVLALQTRDLNGPSSAIPLACEAIETLLPAFLCHPSVHASLMQTLLSEYLQLCELLQQEPNILLLEPLRPYFNEES